MSSDTGEPAGIESSGRSRTRRGLDRLLGPALAVLGAALFALHRFDGTLTRDLALYAYAGQRVAAGDPPYVGVMNRSGPLAHLVPGLGAWLGNETGVDDLLAMRLVMLVLSAFAIWATYALGRALFDSRAAAALGAITLMTIPGWIFYASAGPREKTTMVLLLILTLLALARRRWLVAGACLALATLTWQPVLFAGAATAVTAVLLAGQRRLPALAAGVVGGGVVTAAFVAYFAAVGALPDALDGFVRIHMSYTEQPSFSEGGSEIWEATEEAFGHSTWVLIGGLAALALLGVVHLVRLLARRPVAWPHRMLIAAAFGEAAGCAWSYRTFNGWADALVLVPFALVGIASTAALAARWLPARLGMIAVAVGCVVLVGLGVDYSLTDGENDLPTERAETQAVLDAMPGATIASIEGPQPLVLAHQVNPSQHQMFRLGLEDYVDDTWPGGLDGYAAWLIEQRPDLIAVGVGGWHDWVKQDVGASYTVFGTSPGWYWLVRDDVDPETLAELERAVAG